MKKFGSALTSTQVKETVVVVDEEYYIRNVPDRSDTWLARAPQSFYLGEILDLYDHTRKETDLDFVDSCTMMQHFGKPTHLIEGPNENIKITTPDDFYAMKAILDAREEAQIFGYDNVSV